MTKLITFLITLLVLGKCEGKYDKDQYLNCTDDNECNIGLYCNKFPILRVDGHSHCDKYCPVGSCASTAYCNAGKCAAKKQTGGSCFKSEECFTGLKCIFSECSYGKSFGEYCRSTNDCIHNLVCNNYKCDSSYSNGGDYGPYYGDDSGGGDYGPYYGDDSESTFEKHKVLFVVLIVAGIVLFSAAVAVVVYYQRKRRNDLQKNRNIQNIYQPSVPNTGPVVATVVSANPMINDKTRMPMLKTDTPAHTTNNNQAPVSGVISVPVTLVTPTAPVLATV